MSNKESNSNENLIDRILVETLNEVLHAIDCFLNWFL